MFKNYKVKAKLGVKRLQFLTGKGSKAQFATTQFHQPSKLCVGKVK